MTKKQSRREDSHHAVRMEKVFSAVMGEKYYFEKNLLIRVNIL